MDESSAKTDHSILNPPAVSNSEWTSNKCDKWDYIIAASCGALAGLVDVIFVQSPEASLIGKQTDKLADSFVQRAGEFFYAHDSRRTKKGNKYKKPDDLSGWISYLEQAFPVPYDARYAKDLKGMNGQALAEGVLKSMSPTNHHLLGLAHSTDPIGLVFSIIDQFSGSASFIENGKVIHARPVKENGSKAMYELQGHDLPSMLFCGFVNWIGHILSDLVGSSSTRVEGKTGRGMGVPIPFYELLVQCNVGDKDIHPFADTMIEVYSKGYDFRFGMAMAVPVIIEELMVRVIWIIRQKFIRKASWKDSMPTSKHADLRIMLLVANGALCVVDTLDASIRGAIDKSWVTFVLHMNLVGVGRLAVLGLKEAAIRIGLVVGDEAFLENIFDKIPEKEREQIIAIANNVSKFVSLLDYKAQLQQAIADYRLAHEERIRIEAECEATIEKLLSYRQEMELSVESYFVNYLSVFTEAGDMIDEGLETGNSDLVIHGNNLIQKELGHKTAFEDQDDFDELMLSDDTFKL